MFYYFQIPLKQHLRGPNKPPNEWIELYHSPSIALSLTQLNEHIYHCNTHNTSLHDYINLLVAKIYKKSEGNGDICVLTVGNSEHKGRNIAINQLSQCASLWQQANRSR